MFKIRTPRYLQQPAMFDVGILLTCGNHLHDRIISLRGSFWSIQLVQLRQFLSKSLYQAVMYMCGIGTDCVSVFIIFLLDFGTSDSLVMLFYLSYYSTLSAYQMRMIEYSLCFQ